MTKLLYIDCKSSGIAGDMFLAAAIGLTDNKSILNKVHTYINNNFPNANLTHLVIEQISRNGILPLHLRTEFEEEHPELHVREIQKQIPKLCEYLKLSNEAKNFASKWFSILLDAEQKVHANNESHHIHLHELGSIDTLIDICGGTACLDLMGLFSNKIDIFSSIVAVGGGMVKISHGTVPVPAPATSVIIEKFSIPIRGGPVDKELLTPTGAALIANLKHFGKIQFSENIPEMIIQKTGMSTGKLGNETFPNILRIFSGILPFIGMEHRHDVVVLETMVDDSTGETLGLTMDHLFQKGALDVNFISVQGKKNRPGVLIRVLSSKNNTDTLMKVLIRDLGTLGVRFRSEKRFCLKREIVELVTTIENVSVSFKVKLALNPSNPDELLFFKVEHDDLVRISEELQKPISFIKAKLESAFINAK